MRRISNISNLFFFSLHVQSGHQVILFGVDEVQASFFPIFFSEQLVSRVKQMMMEQTDECLQPGVRVSHHRHLSPQTGAKSGEAAE